MVLSIGLADLTQMLVFARARPIASTGHGYSSRTIAFNSDSVWAPTLSS